MKGIKLREGLLFPILIAFLLFSMVAVISVGSASIDMGTVYRILVDQLFFQGKGTEAVCGRNLFIRSYGTSVCQECSLVSAAAPAFRFVELPCRRWY